MRGPIDFIIVAFKGDKFDGSILAALTEALDKGIIDLLALAVVVKNNDGTVTALDLEDAGDKYLIEFANKYTTKHEVDEDDAQEVSGLLENSSTAGVLIIEHLWAKPLKEALLKAGGKLVAEGRIHPEAAVELNMQV